MRTLRRRRQSMKRVKRVKRVKRLKGVKGVLQKGGQQIMNSLTKFPQLLSVTFNRALDGGEFTMEQTKLKPVIAWTQPPKTDTYYTYICFDLDSRMPAYVHLLVVNCRDASLDSGNTLLDWEPPKPPRGTSVHRYIFGLYNHTYPVSVTAMSNRGGFNVQEYIDANGFIPVAGANMKVLAPT